MQGVKTRKGRKKKFPKSRKVCFLLEPHDIEFLEKFGKTTFRSKTDIIRLAIDRLRTNMKDSK